ncbi:MAG: T9SS type A sorting domain-containing protein [Porphyromonadaceae bacterium]|nr:T9SS type A sorting domain-containing protein [Porphyromonadaceae bacterium]
MKKILLLTVMALTGYFANAKAQEAPAVDIKLNDVTSTTFTFTFTPNSTTNQYYILAMDSTEIPTWEQRTGMSIHRLIQMWGKKLTTTTTYTWKKFVPNTKYIVYALANDSTNKVHQKASVTTKMLGGTGVAEQTVVVSEVTATTATVTNTPNSETSRYYEQIVEKSWADKVGIDSVVKFITKDNPYVRYDVHTWVWPNLTPNTEYLAIAVGFNANNEQGTVTTVSFKTLVSSVETINSNIELYTFPNPAKDNLYIKCDGMTKLELFDLAGNKLHTQNVQSDNSTINITPYSEGTYILKVTSQKGITTQKVVIYK